MTVSLPLFLHSPENAAMGKQRRVPGLGAAGTSCMGRLSRIGARGGHTGALTIRPASTVGTSVSLLPSTTPRSCSFPELRRLRESREVSAAPGAADNAAGGRGGGSSATKAPPTPITLPPPLKSRMPAPHSDIVHSGGAPRPWNGAVRGSVVAADRKGGGGSARPPQRGPLSDKGLPLPSSPRRPPELPPPA